MNPLLWLIVRQKRFDHLDIWIDAEIGDLVELLCAPSTVPATSPQ